MGYSANKKWRKDHPEERNAERRRYYEKGSKFGRKGYDRYTEEEDAAIIAPDRPKDLDLARILNRSMRSIQIRRMRLRQIQREGKLVGRPKRGEEKLSSVPILPDLRKNIDELQAAIGSTNRSETVRRSIKIYSIIQQKIDQGYKLVFRKEDGTEETFIINSTIEERINRGSKLVLRNEDGTEETVVIL